MLQNHHMTCVLILLSWKVKKKILIWVLFSPKQVIIFSFFLVKTEQFSDDRKNCSPKKQTKCESLKGSQQYLKSSPHKIGETSPKASSKLALLKKKEESSYKETEPMASKRKENAIELKGQTKTPQTKTPKKPKRSPAKKEVEIF